MATPAAILQIAVDANTRPATADLTRLNAALQRTDRTSVTATTRTTALGRASRSAGSHLASAARYAAGAAAAYISISQAKAAITTTQELAKTTAGLNRNLGLSTREASRWAAVAKSRDVDARSLTMSFTTLSRRVTDAADAIREGGGAAQSAMEPFARLGISQREVVAGSRDLSDFMPRLANAFGDAAGGAERQASAQQLLGRGYQSILPLFAEGAKGLREQQMWADKYGATLTGKTLKAQMDLVSAQRESKVAWVGLQMVFARAVTPALEEANRQFQKIAAILASDRLTNAEKFERVAKIMGGWADAALDALLEVLPKMVSAVADRAPKIARALVEGIVSADIWGKLAIGGFILARFGGAKAFTAAGKIAGSKFAGGMLIGLALFLPELLMQAYRLGQKIGRVLQDTVPSMAELLSPTREIDPSARMLIKAGLLDEAKEMFRGLGMTAFQASEQVDKVWHSIYSTTERQSQRTAEVGRRNSQRLREGITEDTKRTREAAERDFGRVAEIVGSRIGDAERRGKRGSFDLAKGVAFNIGALAGAVAKGMQNVKENTNRSLGAFNVDPLKYVIKAVGNLLKAQRGAMVVGGTGSGDVVPAMLEPGEVVLNREAVKALGGARRANAINRMVPRFATGGVAGLQPGIARLAQWAGNRYGLRISSGLRPGDAGSYHATGQAVDLVPPGMRATQGIFGAFRNQLAELFYDPWGGWDSGQRIGAIGGHMDHIHAAILGAGGGPMARVARQLLRGPKGPLRSMGQNALDRVRGAANRYLSRQGGMHGNIGNVSGPLQAIARQLVASAWGKGQWPAFNELVMRESGWDPTAVNPSSGAAGLAQALPPSKYPAGAWPYTGKSSAVKQLQWMISYIRGRYGTPAGALAFHDAHNWYRRGGIVGLQRGGSPGYPATINTGRVPGNLMKRLREMRARTEKLNERIQVATTLAGLEGSEAGTELGPGERTGLVSLNQSLLANLTKRRDWVLRALRSPLGKDRRGTLRSELVGLQGHTGTAGSIFDTQMALAALNALPPSEADQARAELLAAQLATSQRANAILTRQLPIFGSVFQSTPWGGSFAGGGVVPGPIGAPRAAVVHGGETITPPGAPVVTVIVNDGAVNPDAIDVRIDDRLAKVARSVSSGAPNRKATYG